MTAFAEREDVRWVMQKSPNKFGDKQLGDDIVDAAIEGVSQWFANATDAYFYDSTKTGSDLIDSSAATATGIIESVPSSPHTQRGQLFNDENVRYPVTRDGVFTRTKLPAFFIESIDTLEVRDRGGGFTDWVADSNISEGPDEDYYVQVDGSNAYGNTYLYLRARTIGSRRYFDDLLRIDVTYGRDEQDTSWADVRRGIAALAAAQLIVDDDVIAQVPDNGQLIGVVTQYDQLQDIGIGEELGALQPYLGAPVA